MIKLYSRLATTILALGFAAPAIAADWQKKHPTFRYGVQSVETQTAAMSRYERFGKYVQEKLGVKLELYLASDYSGVIQAIAAGQIDAMDMGASGYAAAWIETKGGVEPLVVPQELDGSIGYYSVMFVRADSNIRTLEDTKGRSFAWADPNSASGYLFPLVSLRKQGIEPEKHFRSVVFSGGHEQSIIGVLGRAYDVAVTWTNDPEKHTRGGLHMMLQRGVLKVDDIRIIWKSDLIPNPVIAIRSDVPKEMKDDVRNLFLNMRDDAPEVFAEVARGKSSGYVKVDHDVYKIAVDLRQQLANERRRR